MKANRITFDRLTTNPKKISIKIMDVLEGNTITKKTQRVMVLREYIIKKDDARAFKNIITKESTGKIGKPYKVNI